MLKPDIRRLQDGDPFSWDCAFPDLWKVAYSAAYRRLEKIAPNDVKDIAGGAIRESVEEVEAGKVESFQDLKGLVAVIATRRSLDLIRRLRAEKRSTQATESIEEHEELLAAPEPGPLELANANDMAKLLSSLMAILSPNEYQLLRAVYHRRMKQREIAETYGIPLGTIGVTLSRVQDKLREEIEKHPKLMKELQEALR
ncbi:MAG: sigma-70 family RNA polymerase sigma factor [Verrucomicrobiota bacterium]